MTSSPEETPRLAGFLFLGPRIARMPGVFPILSAARTPE